MKTTHKTPRIDIYERITNAIIEKLEEGTAPWQSPMMGAMSFPKNFRTGKHYQGINILLLWLRGYASPWFLTYKQAQELGGQVRKGEKGSLIAKYGTYKKELETPTEDGENTIERGYIRPFTVFNSSQIDGIDFPKIQNPDYQPSERTEIAQAIVDGMPQRPLIEEGRHAFAHYQPEADLVGMPDRKSFLSEDLFFKTLFHELVHSTGHASRLKRKTLIENKGIMFGGTAIKTYAKEKLVAEIGSSFLCAHAGIVPDGLDNSAAYLESWLEVLKNKDNKHWIIQAASYAQKAVDFMLRKKTNSPDFQKS